MERKLWFVLSIALGIAAARGAFASPARAQAKTPQASAKPSAAQQQPPYTEKEVLGLIKHNKHHLDKVSQELTPRGVDFDVTPEIEARLRKAGADDATIGAIKNLGPTARAQRAAQTSSGGGGPQLPPDQLKAFMAVENELDPSKAIQLAEDFAKNYPNSPGLAEVYAFEANNYQEKQDLQHTVQYAEKAAQLKPDYLGALMMVAKFLPQPALIQGSDADKTRKLAEAETDADEAMKLIPQVAKQPNETDDQLQQRKAMLMSDMHASLGMVHLERAFMGLAGIDKTELAKAEQEFKTAVSMSNQADPTDYYRLGDVYRIEGNVDAAIDAYTKAGDAAGAGNPLKTLADQEIAALKKAKGQAAAPAKK